MRRFLAILVPAVSIACVVALVSCGKGPGGGGNAGSAPGDDLRIGVMSPAVAVMLRDLGFESDIVGRHGYDLALDPAIPVVGDLNGVDYETLISVRPTHVFTEFHSAGVPERLTELAAERGWALEDFRLRTLDDIAETMDELHLDLRGVPERSVTDFDPTVPWRETLPSARLANAWRDRGPMVRGAGRVLLIAAGSPPMILGPGSFHHEILTRIGATPARDEGEAWQELDAEDVLHIAPDSIIVLIPERAPEDADARFVEPNRPGLEELAPRLGKIGELPIPAVEHGRVAGIYHPLALLPSSSLADIADEMARILGEWPAPAGVPEDAGDGAGRMPAP